MIPASYSARASEYAAGRADARKIIGAPDDNARTLREYARTARYQAATGATLGRGRAYWLGAARELRELLDRAECERALELLARTFPHALRSDAERADALAELSGAETASGPACGDCGRPLNPAAVMVYGPAGPCASCTRRQHRRAIGEGTA